MLTKEATEAGRRIEDILDYAENSGDRTAGCWRCDRRLRELSGDEERVEELDAKIEETDKLIDEIVYELYELSEEV